ncbi:MerR family transcriptional regulator [Deinococcus misasensis]|uniref:MerR family transcriptional regulator n=1 Tax=Deinococcus misasensis TaxID=392413 RepID=UPI0005500F60|nr:MerR family transcriptional regulator [Deinococcus misasensis]
MTQEQKYTISQVAAQLETSKSKIRYYIEVGLVEPKVSAANKYRIFDENDIFIIRLIIELRYLEIPIEKIKMIIDNPNESFVDAILYQHLRLLKQRRTDLEYKIDILTKICIPRQ